MSTARAGVLTGSAVSVRSRRYFHSGLRQFAEPVTRRGPLPAASRAQRERRERRERPARGAVGVPVRSAPRAVCAVPTGTPAAGSAPAAPESRCRTGRQPAAGRLVPPHCAAGAGRRIPCTSHSFARSFIEWLGHEESNRLQAPRFAWTMQNMFVSRLIGIRENKLYKRTALSMT